MSYNFLRVLQEPKRDTKGVYQGAESLVRAENSFPSHISLPSSYLPLLFIPPLPVIPSHSHPSPGARTKFFPGEGHRRRKGSVVGGAPWRVRGSWGQSLQRGPAAELLVRGRSPPEAESILVIGCPTEPANLTPFQIQGGQVTPVAPSWGRSCPSLQSFPNFSSLHYYGSCLLSSQPPSSTQIHCYHL